jgi:hypothetical protein
MLTTALPSKRNIARNVPPELEASRFWDSGKGRGAAKQSLNDKRKTVIGAMKREFLSK